MFFRKKDEMEIRIASTRDEISLQACLKNMVASLLRVICMYARESEELDTERYRQQLQDISAELRGIEDVIELNQLSNRMKQIILRQKEAERAYDENRIAELKRVIEILMKLFNDFIAEDKAFNSSIENEILGLDKVSRLEDIRLIKEQISQIAVKLQKQVKKKQERLQQTTDDLAIKVLDLEERLSRMTEEALIDETTKLFNRRALMRRIPEEISRYISNNVPFSLVIFDVDNFKQVNDEHNHLIGDRVLHMIGRIAKETFRTDDFVARMAGDEFAALLFGSSGRDSWTAAERLRNNIARKVFKYDRNGEMVSIRISISIGVAWVRPDDSPESLIERADRAMYLAKQRGRNQAVTEWDLEEIES